MKTLIKNKMVFFKKVIIMLLILTPILTSFGQSSAWNGTNTTMDAYRSGKVHIGPNTSVTQKFEVETSTGGDGIFLKNTGGNAVFSMDATNGGQAWTLSSETSSALTINGAGSRAMIIDANRNVGIGIGGTPGAKLHVSGVVSGPLPELAIFNAVSSSAAETYAVEGQNLNTSTASQTNVGVYGVASCTTAAAAIGVKGEATSSGDDCYGGWFVCNGTPGNFNVGVSGLIANVGQGVNAAVFGDANGYQINPDNAYAGYFLGDVFRSGTDNFTSDRKLKDNIQPLSNSLDKIMKLKPSSYTYRTEEFSLMTLPAGKQMGLIAQDLEEVFPELVHNMKGWTGKDRKGVRKTIPDFKSVQYISLIPVLIGAIQEQQKLINDLRAERLVNLDKSDNTTGLNNSSANKSAYLLENVPNPFNQETTINYTLPAQTSSAYVGIYDLNGKQISKHEISQMGSSGIKISAENLSAGIYLYSLVADGKLIDTKRMLVADK